MEIRDKIKQKREAIWKSVGKNGHSDGTVIGTEEEMFWLACQAARDGILLSYRDAPETYQKDNECYYYYDAMSITEEKEDVDRFVGTYPLLSAKDLRKLMPDEDSENEEDQRVLSNLKRIRNMVIARNRRRNKHRREMERWEAEMAEADRIDEERDEAYEHRDDLTWLVGRIESLGWKVTLTRAE